MESFAFSFGPVLMLGAVLGFFAGYAVRSYVSYCRRTHHY